jgi:exopolysaccharide production protein ExoQ
MKRLDPTFRWVAVLWALHVSWMFVSLIWSIYPPLTLRNAVAFALVSVGAFGLGAGFYGTLPNGRELFLRHVFTAGVLSALAVLLPLPFRWQEYSLLDPTQRLDIGGNFPAFVVGPVLCALLVFVGTAILEMRDWRTRDWLWIAVLVLPLLVLKSRGPVLFAALALVVPYLLYKAGARNRVLQAALLCVVGFGAYVFYSQGVYDYLTPYLTRGNVESTATLTGRIPLWEIVLSEIQDHPWLGVGFAAFWNPHNYPRMEQLVGFPVVSAHNGFLDMLLVLGVVGLAFLLAFCLCAAVTVMRKARRPDLLGWLVLMLLIFYVLSNLTSSIFTEFYEFKLIVILSALGLLASRPAKRPGAPRGKTAVARPRVPSLS